MADDRFLADFFAFARRPMPTTPDGPFQTGGWLLRFLAWFVAAGLVLLVVGILSMAMVWIRGTPWPWPGTTGQTLLWITVLAWLASVLFVSAVLNWVAWTYARWREADPRGLVHATAVGIVFLAVGVLQTATVFGQGEVQEGPMAWTNILIGAVYAALGAVLLVTVRSEKARSAFDPSRSGAAR